ncbi:MAG TPA: M56 family metallopeptidase, partial [Gemmataceae bacterium]|nr:M56 family metallopeptidase [Gemmataceae bacterium]
DRIGILSHTPAAPAAVAPAPADASWLLTAAGWIWVGGIAVAALVQLTRLVRLHRLLRRGLPAPDWLRELTAEAAAALKMRPPRVLILPGATSPMVCALGPARLLWPEGLEDRLPHEGRRAVVLHELAHLRRRDHWVGWLLLAAGCMWWPHPLFWWVRRRLMQEAELACDAWVVETLPEARKAYAEALLEVSKRPSPAPAPVLGASSGRRDLERRLVMVMRGKGRGRLSWGALIAVGCLGLLTLPAWSLGQGEAGQPPISPPPERTYYEPVTTYRAVTTYQPVTTYQLRVANPTAPTPPAPVEPPPPTQADPNREKKLKELNEKVQQLLKEIQELRGSEPAVPYSLTDIRAILDVNATPAPAAPPAEVALSRVIYKLPAGHAEATAAFLRDHVAAPVLETRAEGDNLIVTTTPETQKVIRMLVALVQSKAPVAPPAPVEAPPLPPSVTPALPGLAPPAPSVVPPSSLPPAASGAAPPSPVIPPLNSDGPAATPPADPNSAGVPEKR